MKNRKAIRKGPKLTLSVDKIQLKVSKLLLTQPNPNPVEQTGNDRFIGNGSPIEVQISKPRQWAHRHPTSGTVMTKLRLLSH